MKGVIYARYSSHSQTEQSIEGQLKVCREYAERNDIVIIGEYIDRAKTGTNDNRLEFQRMLNDSRKHLFDCVLVYQYDRFARSRYDSAINKNLLMKNGVKVISAKETISDDATGIITEGMLESFAEYYSKELSQKVQRGMDINASKCLSTGSTPAIGYKVLPDKSYALDEKYVPVVREIFTRYSRGETMTEIKDSLNSRGLKTPKGNEYKLSTISKLLRNKRYIGYYIYKETEVPDGMPRIIEDSLFYKVQGMLQKNKTAPASARNYDEYLLTTKLFCGKCQRMMVGFSGYSRNGNKYDYYKCKGTKSKVCDKKSVKKDYIENLVIDYCLGILTEKNIKIIARDIAKYSKKRSESYTVTHLKESLKETDKAIENLIDSIEKGLDNPLIKERLETRMREKEETEKQLQIEIAKMTVLGEQEIYAFLSHLKKNAKTDKESSRNIINLFINAVYLYDDRITIIYNADSTSTASEDIPLSDIENAFNGSPSSAVLGSPLHPIGPPKKKCVKKIHFFFYYLKLKMWIRTTPPPKAEHNRTVCEANSCGVAASPLSPTSREPRQAIRVTGYFTQSFFSRRNLP